MADNLNPADDTATQDVTPEAVMGGLMPADVQASALPDATPFVQPGIQPEARDPGAAFGGLTQTDKTAAANPYSPEQTQRTAMLGALAMQRTGLSTSDDPDGRLGSLTALNQQTIQDGQEKMLRQQIALQTRQNQVESINDLQNKVLTTPDADVAGTPLATLMSMGLDLKNGPTNPDSLEEQGIAHLQTMGASDPDQAAILQDLQSRGDVLDRMRDNVIKMELFNRELDVLKQAKMQQGWGKDAVDLFGSFIPFRDLFSKLGNVPMAAGDATLNPAKQFNREVTTLFNMPLDQFKAQVPQTFDRFTKQTFGLGTDLSKAIETAVHFQAGGLNNSDALSFNVWTGLDVAGFLPIDRMLAVPSKAARLLGNRTASADLSAAGIAAEIHGAPHDIASVQVPYHSIEESLPSSLVPDTQSFVRPDVGVPGDIADRLAQIKTATDEARKGILSQDRLSPAQLREAVEAATERARLEFRDEPTADYKAEIVPAQSGLIDPDADLDNLSYMNARGEVYKSPETNPFGVTEADLVGHQPARLDSADDAKGMFRVARQMPDGSLQIGEKGQVHAELLSDEELDQPMRDVQGKMGFADQDGKFYTREEAAAKLGRAGRLESIRASETTRASFGKKTAGAPTENFVPDGVGAGGIRGDLDLTRNPDTGIYSLNFYLGKRYTSGGFMTQQGAEAAAVRRGFALQDVGIHQNTDGQFFIKVKQAVTETGVTSPTLREADFPDLGYFPRMSAAVKSADNILPEMFNQARISQTVGKQKFLSAVVGPYVKLIKAVNPRGLRSLSKVMQVGEREQKWFTRAEFEQQFERIHGSLPGDKEVTAYYAAKELSDLNYHIFNNALYADKARRGMQTVSATNEAIGFETGRMNGRVIENPNFADARLFDVDEGLTQTNDPVGELAKKYATGNYRVIDLERPVFRDGQDPVKQLFVHKSSSTVGPLDAEQLGYIAGGSRENRFKWFVKQAQTGEFGDGKQYWLNPKTHVAARTKGQATDWANRMEVARKAYFAQDLTDAEKRRIIELSPAETYDKFDAMVKAGEIDKSHPFEALYDRETPQAMSHIGEKDTRWIDTEESPQETYAISKGRMYYSKKGERLVDPNGEYAEILDPFTTLHKATQNAAQTFAFGDYNKKVIDEWSRLAAPYLDRRSVGNNFESYNVFFNGKLSDDFYRSNPQFANSMEMSRNTHKRLLGTQTPEQRMTYNAARRFADWVETKGNIGQKIAGAVLDRMSTNPITAVRGMVFDAKLGFFDPGQLIVQTQTALMAMTADPVNGARTAAMLAPMSHMLINTSENLLDHYAKNLKGLHGLDVQDYKTMIRSLRNSGWLNVGGDMVQLDQYINTIGGSTMARSFNQLREAGRVPFNLSEKFNRLTAYSMAWKGIRDKFPELAGESREFQMKVNKYADDLSMNMTSSSAAMWQKGILSVPTQFLAYQARVLENILPQSFGGSARFTGAQKLRLALGQLFLYGAAGVPAGDEILSWAQQQYQNATGQQLSPEAWRVMSKGFWDTALFYGTDGKLDTDFAQRAGQGAAWTQFFQKLTDGSMNNVLEVAGGPVGAVSGKMVDTVQKIARYMKAEQFGALTAEDFAMIATDLTSQLSSLTRAEKAYSIWKYGMTKDPNSGEAIVKTDQLSAIAAALGIPLRQETEFWDRTRDMKQRDATVREYGKLIAGVRRNAFQAMMDGDPVKEDHYEKLATGLLMTQQDDPMLMTEIAGEANKQLNYSNAEWDSLVERIYQRTGKEPIGGK